MVEVVGGLGVFIFVSITIIAPIVAFIFKKKGFKKMWKYVSSLLTAFILIVLTPILVLSYLTEEKPLIDKMDKAYESTSKSLPTGTSTESIFIEVYTTGEPTTKSANSNVNYVINNYNNKDFEGTLTITAYYKGKEIGKVKENVFLLANDKGYDSFVSADKLNMNYDNWHEVTFKCKLDGRFQ